MPRYLSTVSARSVLILMMAHVANNFLAWRNHLQDETEMTDQTFNYIVHYVFHQLVYFVVLWSIASFGDRVGSKILCPHSVLRLRRLWHKNKKDDIAQILLYLTLYFI